MNRSPEVELYLRLGLGVGWIAKVVLMGLDIPERLFIRHCQQALHVRGMLVELV